MDDDTQARNRLLVYTAVRLGGLAVFFLGIAIIYTNLVRPGGWPQVGAIIAILGVVDAMFAPRILKRAWDQQDAAAEARADDLGMDQPEQ
jgi:membrane protein implicated in regulation of membrane protease activity